MAQIIIGLEEWDHVEMGDDSIPVTFHKPRLAAQQQLMLEAGPLPGGVFLEDGQPITIGGPLGEGLAVGVAERPVRLEDLEDDEDDDEELLLEEEDGGGEAGAKPE